MRHPTSPASAPLFARRRPVRPLASPPTSTPGLHEGRRRQGQVRGALRPWPYEACMRGLAWEGRPRRRSPRRPTSRRGRPLPRPIRPLRRRSAPGYAAARAMAAGDAGQAGDPRERARRGAEPCTRRSPTPRAAPRRTASSRSSSAGCSPSSVRTRVMHDKAARHAQPRRTSRRTASSTARSATRRSRSRRSARTAPVWVFHFEHVPSFPPIWLPNFLTGATPVPRKELPFLFRANTSRSPTSR